MQQSTPWGATPSHGGPLTLLMAQGELEVEFSMGVCSLPREDPHVDGVASMLSRPGFEQTEG